MSLTKEFITYISVLFLLFFSYFVYHDRRYYNELNQLIEDNNQRSLFLLKNILESKIEEVKSQTLNYVASLEVQNIAKYGTFEVNLTSFGKHISRVGHQLIILNNQLKPVFQSANISLIENFEGEETNALQIFTEKESLTIVYHLPIVYNYEERVGFLFYITSLNLKPLISFGLKSINKFEFKDSHNSDMSIISLSDNLAVKAVFENYQYKLELFTNSKNRRMSIFFILLAIFLIFIMYLFIRRVSWPIEKTMSHILTIRSQNDAYCENMTITMANQTILQLINAAKTLKEDIEKKKLNLRRLVTELKEDKNQLKRDNNLLKVLTHDIANPIAVIKGSCDLAKQVSQSNFNKLYSLFEKIEKSVNLVEQIMTHVRDMIAVQSGKKTINLVSIDIQDVVADAKFIFEDRLREKEISIEFSNDSSGVKFIADKITFSNNVFNNILSNAIKFSHRGSKIFIQANIIDNWFHISISDQGEGIPEELLPHLFNPDKKTSRFGTEGEKGTGFGLPVAKTYMDYYGGHIKVESTCNSSEKNGSIFHIYLKIYEEVEQLIA